MNAPTTSIFPSRCTATSQTLLFAPGLNPSTADCARATVQVPKHHVHDGECTATGLFAGHHNVLVTIKADAGQIEQVIMNLAVNARDAMPTKSSLFVQA